MAHVINKQNLEDYIERQAKKGGCICFDYTFGHVTPGFSGTALLAHRLGPRLSQKTRNMEHWILGLNRKQNYYTVVKWLRCQRSSGCVVNEVVVPIVVVLIVVVLIVVVVHSNN